MNPARLLSLLLCLTAPLTVRAGAKTANPDTMNDILGSLPLQSGAVTRMINPENPTGEKGGGAKRTPDPENPDLPHSRAAMKLGKGWKVRPFIRIKAGETATLADIKGPGCINHFWITTSHDLPLRSLVLRIYWDDEKTPSVETPLGDFFCLGFDQHLHTVTSLPVVVAPLKAMNSYWQMPFRKRARITLTNENPKDLGLVAYKVLYKLHDVPEDAAYFHAQWRRGVTKSEHPEHTILDGVKGRGLYVGTYIAWTAFWPGWWGEGEVKFYMDGDTEYPTICDNGTEDYFGGAWCFQKTRTNRDEEAFNTPFVGMPLAHIPDKKGPRHFGLYRWHLHDSIGFEKDLRITVQALGWNGPFYHPLTDDIASTAFWYQREPHAPFPKLPSRDERCR